MQNCTRATLHSSLVLNPVKASACTSGLECCPNSATLKDPLLDRTSWNTESCKKLPLMRQRAPAHGMTCTACWESSYKYKLVCQPFRLGRGRRWLRQRGSHCPNRQCHLLFLGTPTSFCSPERAVIKTRGSSDCYSSLLYRSSLLITRYS